MGIIVYPIYIINGSTSRSSERTRQSPMRPGILVAKMQENMHGSTPDDDMLLLAHMALFWSPATTSSWSAAQCRRLHHARVPLNRASLENVKYSESPEPCNTM